MDNIDYFNKGTSIKVTGVIQPLHNCISICVPLPFWFKFYRSVKKYASKFEDKKTRYPIFNNFLDNHYIIMENNEHIGNSKYHIK